MILATSVGLAPLNKDINSLMTVSQGSDDNIGVKDAGQSHSPEMRENTNTAEMQQIAQDLSF